MLNIVVIDDAREFAALEGDWEDLYRHSPRATPFQSWAWLYSWWESYGEYYQLRIVTVRDEGLLVGLIPLMLKRTGGFGRLLFIGTGLTDYHDILTRKGWESRVSEAGSRALERMAGWHVLDLQQLRPEAAAWTLFGEWKGHRSRVWQDNFPVVDVKPWEELLMSLSKNNRKVARRSLRRAETDGVRHELAGVDEVEQAAQRLVALHREAWQGRNIAPEHLTQRFEFHLRTAICWMTACGLGGISEFRQDGEVIMAQFWVFGRDSIGAYMVGANRKASQRYQFSSLSIWNGVDIARSRNSSQLNLGRGDEPEKLRWSSRIVPNYRAILGRSLTFWSPYVIYQVLYSRVRRYVSSKHAPRWVKSSADRYRALRYTVAQYVSISRRY